MCGIDASCIQALLMASDFAEHQNGQVLCRDGLGNDPSEVVDVFVHRVLFAHQHSLHNAYIEGPKV